MRCENMKKIVMKFGGTSVATGENIRNVANLVAENAKNDFAVIVVVSALDGVTDELFEAAEQARKEKQDYIQAFKQRMVERHCVAIAKAIKNTAVRKEVEQTVTRIIEELEKVLTGICYVGELTPKSKDYVLSFGERLSAPIVCAALRDLKLKSASFTGKEAGIVTDSNFGDANPLFNVTKHQLKERIEPLLGENVIPVVSGYIAATQDGVVTTLGRGGSDYTATIIASALSIDEVWIWTDVDGIMTADPKIVPSARLLRQLSYQEAAELAIFGAKAMHPRALEPIMKENIPARIRNVFNPKNHGTLISSETSTTRQDAVKAVAVIRDVAMINVSGGGMVGAPGSYARILDLLGKNGINVMMISAAASEANISLVIRRNMLGRALSTLEIVLLGRGFASDVSAEDDVSVIAAMGANMKGTPGVASRIFSTQAKNDINIRMIAQGSSELNISFVVKEKDGKAAVQAIHQEFRLDKVS
jgi:aspartate kinase